MSQFKTSQQDCLTTIRQHKLGADQLKSIYTWKVSNWKELGGSSIPIKAYSRRVYDGGTDGMYFASAPEAVPQCSIKPVPLGRKQG